MENFVLNGNGQIDINRNGMEPSTYRFHLQEINHNTEICSSKDLCDDTATSVSSYSNYKQRIDAMFDDSRSILSDVSRIEKKRKLLLSHRENQQESCKERIIANNIQEKIEKIFQDISVNGFQRQNSVLNRSFQKDRKFLPSPENGQKHNFSVTYLGSKSLQDKNVSLMSLQDPLKELYFEYKRKPPKDKSDVLTISKEGLKITICGKEEHNPFSTIAVWASVKLSFRATPNGTEYAFLPLIIDPDGVDKNLLFKELKKEDMYIAEKGNQDKTPDDNQFPVFAVVMKNVTKNKQLECHGFVCKSSEEAVVIAANLYQALMKKLRKRKDQKEQKIKKVEKEIVEVTEPEENRMKPKVKVKKPAPPVPQKPQNIPDENEIVVCNPSPEPSKRESSDLVTKLQRIEEKKEAKGKISERRGSVPGDINAAGSDPPKTLRRTVSDRGSNGLLLKDHSGEGGDILTKVAIPRSSSFLNANGPLSRFSGRLKNNKKNEIQSPLGFKELFNEFKLHEGLESMDDILNAIIDAEGMSFNDLKPIYKEFLLKLAVTLTKDELYQRSKTIMRRQKKRNKNCSFRKKAFMSSIGLHKIFRKTASRLGKSKNSKPTNLEFTSVVFQSSSKQFEPKQSNNGKSSTKLCRVKKRPSSRRKLNKRSDRIKNKNISTTSEDSDFFQPKRNTNDSCGGGPNRASSGYFSCSECSCDSDNCTCLRSDKCYCTLGEKSYNASSSDESRFISKKKSSFRITRDQEDSLKSCSCDTESCVDSAKCYCTQNKRTNKVYHLSDVKGVCQTPHLHQNEKSPCPVHGKTGCRNREDSIFEQLKEQGFAGSESTLSRAASPATAWQTNERNLRQRKSGKPSGSLEYYQVQRPECQRYPNFEENLLREIQNTTRHTCVFSSEMSLRNRDIQSTPSFPCGRRQYSSMRCRNECVNDHNPESLRRSMSYRTKNFFNSVRSKHSCDSIMNHIKFPNGPDSSLRFTRRMDVYNSFSEIRHRNPCGNRPIYKENRQSGIPEHNEDFGFRENFQRLDYNIFGMKPDCRMNKKKVLVVSARDPKGKVLYMGTSNRSDASGKVKKNFVDHPATAGSEALAVKKSAEIAALFSDVATKQKPIHPDYVKDQKHNNYRTRSNSYRSTNLENTLGYLP